MISHIIIAHYYNPGSAATNRIIAYAKGYNQLGLEVDLVLGYAKSFSFPVIQGVRVSLIIEPIRRRLSKAMAKATKRLYSPNNTAIQLYGSPALCYYLPKNRFNVFYECTEIPNYGKSFTLKSMIKEGIKIKLVKKATGVMVISKALRDYYVKNGITNIAIINMFVDVSRFSNIGSLNETDKYIAYCGTISLHKDGVDDLIRAFKLFHERYDDYRLWIIGGFENKETQIQLSRLIESLGVSESVRFVGRVEPDEMPGLLMSSRILALARPNNKQAQYGFPTKLGEYLATGRPVVVTRVGEIGDFLTDGKNCFFAESDNPESIADKFCWIADHYLEALTIGHRGKRLTSIEFSSIEQCKIALDFMDSISSHES